MPKKFEKLATWLVILIVLAILLVTYLLITKFIIKPTKDLDRYIDTSDVVQLDWPLDYDREQSYRYYVLTGDDLDGALAIINNGVLYETYGDRWLYAHKYDRQEKTATFHLSDGTTRDIIFYGPGTSYFKIRDGKYGYARYKGASLGDYIYSLHGEKLRKERDTFIPDHKDFEFEDLFGPNYDQPWCGY